jgi:hypothetical protein
MNIEEKIYDRFCKEKDKLNKDRELNIINYIINNSKTSEHDIYVMYGVDTIGGKCYNEHIKEIKRIING